MRLPHPHSRNPTLLAATQLCRKFFFHRAPYPAAWYIHERFEAQALRTPEAVVYEDRELT